MGIVDWTWAMALTRGRGLGARPWLHDKDLLLVLADKKATVNADQGTTALVRTMSTAERSSTAP